MAYEHAILAIPVVITDPKELWDNWDLSYGNHNNLGLQTHNIIIIWDWKPILTVTHNFSDRNSDQLGTHQQVTDKIIQQMEAGTIPFVKTSIVFNQAQLASYEPKRIEESHSQQGGFLFSS